jgi:hypothetical protein
MPICRKMDGTGDHHFKTNKPESKRQIPHFLSNAEYRLRKKKR